MSIINKSELFRFQDQNRAFSKGLNGSLNEFFNESQTGKTTIFLSHKHNEKKELDSAIQLLKKLSVRIYVDWLDEEMPKYTSGITATRIKEKIKENDKFIFLATEGAINSRWCNWELGIGDTYKYIENIALLPIKNDHDVYSGNEYLQIYPTIEYVRAFTIAKAIGGYFDKGFYVVYPEKNGRKSYIKLIAWLAT